MSKTLTSKFISPTGALAPKCESGQILQIMAFATTIDLEELADCDGDYRAEKYYDLYPEPEDLKTYATRLQAYACDIFRMTDDGWEFADDGSEQAQEIQAFLAQERRKKSDHEDSIIEKHPTAITWETFGTIEKVVEAKEEEDRLNDFIDEYPDGPPDFEIGFELHLEGEYSEAKILKTFLSDASLIAKLKEQSPAAWANLIAIIQIHADMVPQPKLGASVDAE